MQQLLEIMSTVGTTPSAVEEAQLIGLTEAYFSKEDLQNPNTLKKILNKKHTFISIGKCMAIIIGIILMIVSIPTLVGPLCIGIVMVNAIETLQAYPKKYEDKTISKLEKACMKYKNRLQKDLEKHPDKKSDIQKNMSEVDKVLDEIKRYRKSCEDEKFMEEIKEAKAIYADLRGLCKGFGIENWDFFHLAIKLAKMIGITEGDIMKGIANNIKNIDAGQYNANEDIKDWAESGNYMDKAERLIPELKSNGFVQSIVWGDDTLIVYSPSRKKMILVTGDNCEETSLFKQAHDVTYGPSKEAFVEADKELGYYRLSKCPEAVKPKEFP